MDEAAEEVEEELPKVESSEDLARIVQAIVFASPDIVTLKKLREILGDFLDARTVSEALIAANDSLNSVQVLIFYEQSGKLPMNPKAA